MHRRAAVVISAIVFGLGTASCKTDKDAQDKSDSAATSASVAVVTTTTSTTEPAGPASSPQAAADGLYTAWVHNSQDEASRYAKPQAISKLFAHPYAAGGGTTYAKQPCEPQGGQFLCSWTYEGGALQMTVENWPGGGFVVDAVTFIAD